MPWLKPTRPGIGLAGMALVLLALTSCQTTGSGEISIAKGACAIFKPITWSGEDTLETAQQVREHNAAWKAVCSPE